MSKTVSSVPYYFMIIIYNKEKYYPIKDLESINNGVLSYIIIVRG